MTINLNYCNISLEMYYITIVEDEDVSTTIISVMEIDYDDHQNFLDILRNDDCQQSQEGNRRNRILTTIFDDESMIRDQFSISLRFITRRIKPGFQLVMGEYLNQVEDMVEK